MIARLFRLRHRPFDRTDPDPYTRLDRMDGLGEPLPSAEPHQPRGYLWLATVVLLLVVAWLVYPWPVAVFATGLAVTTFLATLMAHGAETRRLLAWYEDELGRADDELDEYDRLRASLEAEERAA